MCASRATLCILPSSFAPFFTLILSAPARGTSASHINFRGGTHRRDQNLLDSIVHKIRVHVLQLRSVIAEECLATFGIWVGQVQPHWVDKCSSL